MRFPFIKLKEYIHSSKGIFFPEKGEIIIGLKYYTFHIKEESYNIPFYKDDEEVKYVYLYILFPYLTRKEKKFETLESNF